ncbi:predicted protein [Lichtheimia corymbifera JMRC:FSU:9682]|uniref:Uncharacterized protein n=1 Tax=Lichtheimia corymbifera JMRC:FSU:9682 TaxID=1263082 RepID=A0A068RZC6_9FUNG|nr:predicted protein [Lichtheimia corymbifera JMRC:FSU:9682]
MGGPSQKLDLLIKLMQRLLVVKGPAPSNYVTVTVVGANAQSKLKSLKMQVGKLGKPVAPHKLHFSVAKTRGTWTSEQVAHLAHVLRKYLLDSPAPAAIKTSFICDETAFINCVLGAQVLGVTPSDKESPAHKMIGQTTHVNDCPIPAHHLHPSTFLIRLDLTEQRSNKEISSNISSTF